MLKKILMLSLGSIFCFSSIGLVACAPTSTKASKEVVKKTSPTECPGEDNIVIGEAEMIRILPADIIYDSRIDTGATTTSIHAKNIEIFERDGKKWVQFELQGKDKTEKVEMKVKKFKNIKRHGAPDQIRAVVTLHLVLGKISQNVDVTLNDRSKFTYPGLIGRNFLKPNNILVDVNKKYTAKPAKK